MAPRTALTLAPILAACCLASCDEKPSDTQPKTIAVTISGKKFTLETAFDDPTRFRGLSGRTEIKPEGGMIFVFPDAKVQVQGFVMRDCPNPIDIIYLDRASRVTATHTMQPEPPRSEPEKVLQPPFQGAPDWAKINPAYESRLKQYSSRFPAQYVIELKGETLKGLKISPGDKVELPADLKKWAK